MGATYLEGALTLEENEWETNEDIVISINLSYYILLRHHTD